MPEDKSEPEEDDFVEWGAIDWLIIPTQSTTIYTNAPIKLMRQVQRRSSIPFMAAGRTDKTVSESTDVQIQPRPFTAGGCRYAYKARLRNMPFVLKKFKRDRSCEMVWSITPR